MRARRRRASARLREGSRTGAPTWYASLRYSAAFVTALIKLCCRQRSVVEQARRFFLEELHRFKHAPDPRLAQLFQLGPFCILHGYILPKSDGMFEEIWVSGLNGRSTSWPTISASR